MPESLLGLRERKKLKTRAAIQAAALRLFLDRGYQETTVDEIAEAVEISPSTFFNYFPNKEAVVLQDELDPLLLSAFASQAAELHPIAALRNAMREIYSRLTPEQDQVMRERMALIVKDANLRAALLGQFAGMLDEVADVMARRTSRGSTDFAVRNLSGALLGVYMAAMVAAAEDPSIDVMQRIDEAMAHLQAGLPL